MSAKIKTKATSTFITRAKIGELLNNGDNKETMYTKIFHGRFTGYSDNNN